MKRITTEDFILNLKENATFEETYLAIVEEDNLLQGEKPITNPENWKVYKSHKIGGTIINFKNDICIANFSRNNYKFGIDFLQLLANYLFNRGLNALVLGNDILIDGKYKVASYASSIINGMVYTAVHISLFVDLDIIYQFCDKSTIKIPKGLNDYNITTKEIEHFIINNIDSII